MSSVVRRHWLGRESVGKGESLGKDSKWDSEPLTNPMYVHWPKIKVIIPRGAKWFFKIG